MFVGIFFMNTVFRLLGLLLLLYPVLLFLFQKINFFFCSPFISIPTPPTPPSFLPFRFSLTFVFFTHFRFSHTPEIVPRTRSSPTFHLASRSWRRLEFYTNFNMYPTKPLSPSPPDIFIFCKKRPTSSEPVLSAGNCASADACFSASVPSALLTA